MEKKTIVVFGATGNLGAYTVMELLRYNFTVIAVGHRANDNNFFKDHGATYYSVDICNKESMQILPTHNIYGVVHLAGELPSRYEYNPASLIDSIIKGTLNVLEYIRSVKAEVIIFPQTPFDVSNYHNTTKAIPADTQRSFPTTGDHSIYTIAKNAAVDLIEHYHYQYGIRRFILRFFTIYQYHPSPFHYANYIRKKMPYRILIDKAIKGEPIEIWGDPKRAKEMVYIKDFTYLVRLCLESPIQGGIYNVGNGWQVTLEEQIQGIINVFSPKEKKSPIIYRPEKQDSLQAAFDISKTQQELNYSPQFSYLESLKDLYQEMQEEPFAQLWGKKDDYE